MTYRPLGRKLLRDSGHDPRLGWSAARELASAGNSGAVPLCLELLKRGQGATEDREATALIQQLGAAAIAPLIEALASPVEDLARFASDRLAELAPASVPELIGVLRHRRVRYWAIAALSGAHDGRATAPLIELSRQKRSRERAVWALGRLGDASALPVLIEALADRSKEVRMTAARALGVLGDHRGAGPLIELLRDPDRDLRAAAVFGLGHLGDERAIEPLLDLARREVDVPLSPADSAVQAAAACGEAGREAVLRATADAHPGIRSYAASTFKRPYGQELDEERVLVALVRLLHDPRAAIGATDALLSATGRRVVELVLPLFSNTDPGVRKNAIRAIWGHADADAITRTIELLETDQDPTVRATAAWGLGVSKQPQSQEPLRHAAEGDRDPAVRGTSLRSLARIARHDRGSPHDSGGAAFNSSTSATVRHTCT